MTKNNSVIDRIRKLKSSFDTGQIATLKQHEVNPGLEKNSRENYMYFTLPVSINFQRNSPAMWQSALKTFDDPKTNYLFFPELVVQEQREKVMEDLAKHKLGLQRNKHTDIWLKLSQTFNQFYHNDPREFFAKNNYDVKISLNSLQSLHRKEFPYLSGPKLANYWHLILSRYTDAKFKNLHLVSIIPDTHVKQASMVLGLTRGNETPEQIAQIWFEALAGSEILPIEMHSVLWNWSRNKFKPEV